MPVERLDAPVVHELRGRERPARLDVREHRVEHRRRDPLEPSLEPPPRRLRDVVAIVGKRVRREQAALLREVLERVPAAEVGVHVAARDPAHARERDQIRVGAEHVERVELHAPQRAERRAHARRPALRTWPREPQVGDEVRARALDWDDAGPGHSTPRSYPVAPRAAAGEDGRAAMIPDHARTILRVAQRRAVTDEDTRELDLRTLAILVTDFSGFTRTALEHGDLGAIARIARMREVILPCIIESGGMLVKFEADNTFSAYDSPAVALSTAMRIHAALDDDSDGAPPGWHLRVGIGIGYGPLIGWAHDFFGAEFNVASKLGEDTADGGETLLTSAIVAALRDTEHAPHIEEAGRLPAPLDLLYYRYRAR